MYPPKKTSQADFLETWVEPVAEENQEFSSEKVKFENLFRCSRIDVIKATELEWRVRSPSPMSSQN